MYLALYRKYRPRTFDDVISQPHIVTTLKNQIATGQNAHAYIFTGSRGTGKTTCAKILAMALNCKHPVNGNPCLQCESCREIASGSSTDILEIDAASNSSVNDVHELQEQLSYTPVSCKYRVYIMDEVHMLSTTAFNALLKTIEEPPPHVIFIFATTELHKVPATILSRCQRFEFRRIEIADSSARLMSVAESEGVVLTGEAADLISRLSDGGMRDALSLLDRCIAMNKDVTEDIVRECAGVADNRYLFQFADMISAKDIPGCIRLLEQLYKGSKDISRIMEELSGVFRDIMLCHSAPAEKELLSVLPHDYPEIERLAGLFTLEEILRCLTLIQECADGIAKTRNRRTLAEMCFVKLCTGTLTAEPTASARPAAKSVQTSQPVKTAEFKPMGSEFAPLPDDKLKPKQAQNVNKIREIFNQPEETTATPPEKQAEAPAPEVSKASAELKPETADNISKIHEILSQSEEKKPIPNTLQTAVTKTSAPVIDEPPPPELNSKPAAPEEPDFVPPLEEPPEEFIPQREFETSPVKSAEPAKPIPPDNSTESPKSAEPAKQSADTAPEKPEVPKTNGYEKLTGITAEEWNSVMNKVSPLYSAMLDGSTVSVNTDGALEIHSGNLMLQGMINSGYQELEKELEAGLGKKVRVIVISTEQEKTDGDENSAVKELLEKAKRLNIEVQYK